MTGGLNRTILAGRLVADPEIRYTKNETAVAHFRMAINCYGSKDVEFISCVAWGGLAKISGEYLKKGRMIAVEGKLQFRSFKTKAGQSKSTTEVVIENLQMLDSKFYDAAEKAKDDSLEILPV